ncbi:hypothetical protein [Altererythrobacter sp.]|uniref:hypothetical protein n=1 Tax=Altererythrobacter sp. TaxID=1872480 RepID=UPI003D047B21
MAAALGILLSASVASASSSYVTGTVWKQSTENEKLAYTMGIANTVNAEHEVQAASANPPNDKQSAVPEMYAALKGATLEGMVDAVDAYFAAHPDKTGDTVLDVLWLIYVEKKQ